MHKRLAFLFLLGLFFISGVLMDHYKPELLKIPFSFAKLILVNENSSVFEESESRLSEKFNTGSCGTEEEGYSFFVAGHVYGKPGTKYEGIYEPFKSNETLKKCSFMPLGFLVGDAVVEASNHEFNILKRDIKTIGNNTKIYISPGNHEVGTGKFNAKRDIYLENFNETFGFLQYKNDLFILLDANLHNWNIIGDQLQMLKDLKSGMNDYDNVFIFSHQVIWIDGENKKFSGLIPNSQEGRAKELNFWNEVFPIINNIGKKIFLFAGDVGAFDNESEFFFDNLLGVNFFATGMGGGEKDNFLLLHVDQNEVRIELVKLNTLP